MSRSYKHTPGCGDRNSKGMKKIANHRLRQKLKDPEVSFPWTTYRKNFCSWDIKDYYFTYHFSFSSYYQEQVERWKNKKDIGWLSLRDEDTPPTREEVWKEWLKLYIRK